jgi:hypothetical protein
MEASRDHQRNLAAEARDMEAEKEAAKARANHRKGSVAKKKERGHAHLPDPESD